MSKKSPNRAVYRMCYKQWPKQKKNYHPNQTKPNQSKKEEKRKKEKENNDTKNSLQILCIAHEYLEYLYIHECIHIRTQWNILNATARVMKK